MGLLGGSKGGLEDELKTVAKHEEAIGEGIENAIATMENYESELFRREEGGDISAEQAKENLKSILIEFEQKIEQIEEKRARVEKELSAVKEDMKESGDVPEQFVNLEQRMESNMTVVEEMLDFIQDEQNRLKPKLDDAEEKIENGQERMAMKELERVEEVDSEDLDEARQKFENQWSQLLK